MKMRVLKRVLSLMLCLVLVASYLPAGIVTAVAEGSGEITGSLNIEKVADPSTKDDWRSYFGTDTAFNTEFAGAIWTDKSVFTDASAFSNIVSNSQGNPVRITMTDPNDMLVALSAMGSTMTITGQSSVPTDTMLVLDVSGSMNGSSNNNDVAEELAEAANTTIQELLTSNPSNRVGVVLYSGTSSSSTNNDAAVILLPLGRYTTGSDNEYVSYTSTGWWDTTETISLDSDVRIEGTSTRPSSTSKEVVGATYIQKGIMLAANQLTADSNETTANGVPRKPIMVLMSDGAPTLSTTSFTAPGQYNLGNGQSSSTSAAQGFVTQLSCAYAKAKVEEKYANDALFYTIGLGTTGDQVATSVLDPAHSNSGINEFWRQYNLASVGSTVNVQGSGGNARSVTKIDTALEQNYADKYIGVTADTNLAQGLLDAFEQIVGDIQLQSKYHPTLVGSNADLSGYISFVDKIGTYLSVTDVKGILLHEQLFSGQHLAQNFVEDGGILGTEANPTATGTAMMESVRDRLGVGNDDAARSLIKNAYYYGQLSYDAASGKHSNYIGWYADAAGNYMGFYHEGVTQLPSDAVYTVKSYGFLGDTDPAHGVSDTDMMYVTVQVRHNIATGEEEMLLKIPASLIPLVTYEVSLNENGDLTALEKTGADYPIRLLYEVGLDSHISALNLTEYVSDDYLATVNDAGKNITVNADGSVNFFTNKFDVNLETGYGTVNTYSYFNPSHQNDRYYFQENSLLYTDQNGTLYRGSHPRNYSSTLYWQHTHYEKINGTLRTDVHYQPISPEVVATAVQTSGASTWYIPEDTVRTYTSGFDFFKGYTSTYDPANNPTDTLHYAKIPFVDAYGYSPDDANHSFVIGSTLGNNGKITLMPETGIKLTKEMAEGVTAPASAFTFTIENLTNTTDSSAYAAVLVAADGTESDTNVTFAAGTATVQLKAGETLYIIGMRDGSQYQIKETAEGYTVDSVNGDPSRTTALVTVANGQMVTAAFVNKEQGTGNLMITKEVSHATAGHTVPASVLEQSFSVEVRLPVNLARKTFPFYNGTGMETVTVPDNGILNLTVKHGQTIAILDLPEGTVATVTELTNGLPAYFRYDRIATRDHTGATEDSNNAVTIYGDANATAVVYNVYTPASTTAQLDVTLAKDFRIESPLSKVANFQLYAQQWTGTEWKQFLNYNVAYPVHSSGIKEYTFTDALKSITYTEVGDYAYRVFEKIPADDEKIPGVSYDRSVYDFTVRVTDEGGALKATVIDDGVEITGNYKATFVNTYHTAPVSIDVVKELDIASGSADIAKSGFLFAAFEANADFSLVDETPDLTVRSDSLGNARFAATYNQAGTHYFVVKEIDEGRAGWIYDAAEYHVTVVVTEEADGNLVAAMTMEKVTATGTEAVTGSTITFKNTYDPTDASLDLDAAVRKELTGRALKDGEFTFGVFPDGQSSYTSLQNAVLTGINDANGAVDFSDKLTFSKVGTYRYDVVEMYNGIPGVTYSTRIYDLVVEVTDDGNGQLAATYYYEDATGQTATFTNRYTAAQTTYTVTGNKQLTGKALINDEFMFVMTQVADANGTALADAQSWQTTNTIDGSFSFPAITYTAPGTYYYQVSERQEATTGGITFDQSSYIVTVTVTDNGVGQLAASGAVNSPNGQILFTNHYVPAKTSGTLAGNKVLEGKVLGAGAYKFQLHDSNAAWEDLGVRGQAVPNDDYGKFQFPEIAYTAAGTYYYLVSEVDGGKTIDGVIYDDAVFQIMVQVTDDLKGQLHAETYVFDQYGIPQIGVEFVNVYTVTGDTGLVLTGIKQLTGKELVNGDFTFQLFETDSNYAVSGAPIATTTNQGGQFAFNLGYTAQDDLGKTYYYVVQEQNAGQTIDGIAYDNNYYPIMVVVKDDNKGGIELDVTVNASQNTANKMTTVTGLNFTNTYYLQSTTVTLNGTKTLNGMRALKENDFTFELYKTGSNFSTNGLTPVTTIRNGADGKFTFAAQELATAGDHYFVIKESKANPIGGVSYDSAEYRITVTAVDNNKGQLEVTSKVYQKVTASNTSTVSSVSFTNSYDPDDATVTLSGTKSLTGKNLAADMFTFQLYKTSANFATTGITPTETKNAANGSYSFTLPTFDAEGTYYYVVKELNAGTTVEGTTYASTQYQITVVVTDNENGKLIPAVTASGGSVAVNDTAATVTDLNFANSYEAKANTISFSGTKTLTGFRPLKADDFTFQLYKTDSSFAITGLTPVETAKNGGTDNKQFFFGDQTLDTAGDHYFVIKESSQSPIGGVTYDNSEYHITVKVTDDGKGQLQVGTPTYQKVTNEGTTAADSIAFTNVYDPADATVSFSGIKTYNKTLSADKFSFVLSTTNAEFIDNGSADPITVNNAGDGTFAFGAKTFTQPGTYYFQIKEVNGGNTIDGITYDATKYNITVVVTDDENGKLIPTVTVDNSQATVAHDQNTADVSVKFQNTYTAAATAPVSLTGGKTLFGEWTLKANDFTFQMFKADSRFVIQGDALQTVTNDENGSFSFDNITFDTAGSHYFVIKESSQNAINGMTYDDTVYHLTVEVTDNLQGELEITDAKLEKITTEGAADVTEMIFTNSYDAEDATLVLSGKKVLEGKALLSGEFTFLLQQTDDKFVPWTGHGVIPSQTVNAGDGSFTFDAITYDTVGTYYYIVTEVDTGNERTTFDETVYKVTITVTDENGVLKATAAYATENASVKEMVFTNVYTPKPADLPLTFTVNKTVKNIGKEIIGPEGFTFVLEESEDAKIEAVSGKDGKASFDLTVTEDMIGETFKLKLYEKNDGKKNVTYSTAVYEITVAVSLGADNKLVADLTVNGKAAEQVDVAFENVYDYTVPATPYTGDNTSVIALFSLLGVSALALAAAVIFRKKFLA